ncbi:MAG: sulfurtransferase [Candidatus Dactylopiibacterium sp.]|nr:sulfurtransferase [Candidatus Dactylopiibacterium sp.]
MPPLMTAAELHACLDSPEWRVFDVRHDLADAAAGEAAFLAGHIPGAQFLHMDRDLSAARTGRNGRHPLPAREDFAALLGARGLAATNRVAVYDASGGMMAARLWWMLRWLGHEAVCVVDGGLPAWQAARLPLETGPARAREATVFPLRAARTETLDAQSVLAALERADRLIVDARSPDRFRGENETLDPVGGHIPGAKNRFFKDNLAPDGRFKPAATLREEWTRLLGETPPAAVVAQCGSGITACHNLLALEIAGLPGAALYPGSWSEWCADPARPVATGAL